VHSFRGDSTSKTISLGVPLDVVLKRAEWKNAGTTKEKLLLLTSKGLIVEAFHCLLLFIALGNLL